MHALGKNIKQDKNAQSKSEMPPSFSNTTPWGKTHIKLFACNFS